MKKKHALDKTFLRRCRSGIWKVDLSEIDGSGVRRRSVVVMLGVKRRSEEDEN